MPIIPRTALYVGVFNLVLGVVGFIGPFVTGGGAAPVNIETGLLFGVIAMNWAHALVHVVFGVYGIRARRTVDAATMYLWAVAIVFGALVALGLLAQAGVLVRRSADGMPLVVEVAVNAAANVLHVLLAAIGLGVVILAKPGTPEAQARRGGSNRPKHRRAAR